MGGGGAGLRGGNFENQLCRRSHLKSFCNAIKVSYVPELCLFADVSEEKVPIYSMLLNVFEASRASTVGCAYRQISRRSRVRSSCPANPFYNHSLPSADSRRAVVSYWRKNVYQVLVNCRGGLPRNSVDRLTDCARNDLKCFEGQ